MRNFTFKKYMSEPLDVTYPGVFGVARVTPTIFLWCRPNSADQSAIEYPGPLYRVKSRSTFLGSKMGQNRAFFEVKTEKNIFPEWLKMWKPIRLDGLFRCFGRVKRFLENIDFWKKINPNDFLDLGLGRSLFRISNQALVSVHSPTTKGRDQSQKIHR